MGSATTLELFRPKDVASASRQRINRVPETAAELSGFTHLVLGHVTSTVHLKSILVHGLQPNTGHTRPSDKLAPSDETSVYLLSAWDGFYVGRARKLHGGDAAIIVVRVPLCRLEADEAMFPFSVYSELSVVDVPKLLFRSLSAGVCKHRGGVETQNILGVFDGFGVAHWD